MNKSSIIVIIILITAGISISAIRFTDNGNGTVTDSNTGLIWQKCSNGLSGTDCSTGTVASDTWVNALSYCEGLSLGGRTDWRLPSINELRSIVDTGNYLPAINAGFFPNTTTRYWSSSVYVSDTTSAWIVDFNHGSVSYNVKSLSTIYVRCVTGP